jgi:hypothetical protein
MSNQRIKTLITKLKLYVEQLESELACAETYGFQIYNKSLHDELKLFEEWYTEQDDNLCP